MAIEARIGNAPFAGAAAAAGEAGGEGRLWDDLGCVGDNARFAQAWLSVIARTFPSIRQGVVLLPSAAERHLAPVARWASDAAAANSEALQGFGQPLIERALASGKPETDRRPGAESLLYVTVPLMMSGSASAMALVEARADDDLTGRRLVRHLQWGLAWVEAYLRRSASDTGQRQAERAADLIDFLAISLEADGLENVGRSVVSELATRFGCDRVAIGRRLKGQARLLAMSQSAEVERRSDLGEAFEAAMDEACDQALILGSEGRNGFVAYAQMALAQQFAGAHVLTVPLMRDDGAFGAVSLVRSSRGFSQDDIELIDAFLAPAAAILHDKALSDRSLPVLVAARGARFVRTVMGPRFMAAKLLVLATALLAVAAWFARDTYHVVARGQVQGEVRRVVTAPFDGFIKAQHARAGETVRSDQLLAELQDNDLTLDRLRHLAQKRQYQLDHDRALARRELAQVNIAKSQMDQKDAELQLTETMLGRTRLKAPFDAVVVSGDLSQQIGRPVTRGDVLFELAPLDRYRLTLIVPELQIGSIKPGLTGQVLLTALPEEFLAIEIESVTPVARVSEGVNGFEVLARLKSANPRIRPSMEGVAKIDAGEARIIWIWTHQFWRWLHIRLWAWLP